MSVDHRQQNDTVSHFQSHSAEEIKTIEQPPVQERRRRLLVYQDITDEEIKEE